MQRRRHGSWGPRCALVAGILLGALSLVLYQNAYGAASPGPYPGPIALPGIPNGPALGCNTTGSDNATWVCGFDLLSSVTFKVDGRSAGTAQVDSDGCVLILVTFLPGEVRINGNAPVPDARGANTLTVIGRKTVKGVKKVVGLTLHFSTPKGSVNSCGPPPTTPTSSSTVTTLRHPRAVTTSTHFYPTTLAKVTETPLAISPNKVILETSLVAGVLGAALSAGALGAMWGGPMRNGLLEDTGAVAPATTGPPTDPPPAPDSGPPSTPEPPAPLPSSAPAAPSPAPEPDSPSGGPGAGESSNGPSSAFSRPNGGAK